MELKSLLNIHKAIASKILAPVLETRIVQMENVVDGLSSYVTLKSNGTARNILELVPFFMKKKIADYALPQTIFLKSKRKELCDTVSKYFVEHSNNNKIEFDEDIAKCIKEKVSARMSLLEERDTIAAIYGRAIYNKMLPVVNLLKPMKGEKNTGKKFIPQPLQPMYMPILYL